MDSLIYLVVVAVISLLLRSAGEKKRKQSGTKFDEIFGEFKSVLEERQMEDNEEQLPRASAVENRKSSVRESTIPPPIRGNVRRTPLRTVKVKPVEELESMTQKEEASLTPRSLVLKDFSLRKAVIYSEIMKPKF